MRNFNEKPKIKSNSIYFQLGLIVALAVALFFIEQTSVKKTYKDKAVKTDVFAMEDSYDEPLVVEKEQVKKVERNSIIMTTVHIKHSIKARLK